MNPWVCTWRKYWKFGPKIRFWSSFWLQAHLFVQLCSIDKTKAGNGIFYLKKWNNKVNMCGCIADHSTTQYKQWSSWQMLGWIISAYSSLLLLLDVSWGKKILNVSFIFPWNWKMYGVNDVGHSSHCVSRSILESPIGLWEPGPSTGHLLAE